MLYARRKRSPILKIFKKGKCKLIIVRPAKVICKLNGLRQIMINIKELREYCSHETFLKNLPENRFQTTKMTRKTGKKGLVVNIKYIVTGTTKIQ